MVHDEAERGCCPFLRVRDWAGPMVLDGRVGGCSAGEGEGGACEGGVFDGGTMGEVVEDVVQVAVSRKEGEVDCECGWEWGEGAGCSEGKACGGQAVGVSGVD
jgi:hypothetical protein